MKTLKSIFKKGTKENSKIKIEKLDKTKLEKVVGGAETTVGGKANGGWIENTCSI